MLMVSLAFITWHLSCSSASAQSGYTLSGEVEPVVHVGENFKLRYKVNTTDARNFTLGQIPDALDVLIGPSQSTSISTVIVNGVTTTSETLTLTYVLSANETGKFTIPPASVKVAGHTIKSHPLTVQVIPGRQQGAQHGGTGGAPASVTQPSSQELFVQVIPSKRRVTEYEPFLLTYKVCWHPDVPVYNLDPISLELQDIYMQPYNDVQQKSKKAETINGQPMMTVDWQQYVIYPQKAGTLHIPSMKLLCYLREATLYDPFDPFSQGFREVPRQLTTPAIDIKVDSLPQRPGDFSGGVGRFDINGQLSHQQVKENTPITLKVKVSGRGNLNMLKEPLVLFPRGFDTYDTKQTEDFELTANGLSGCVDYEFMAVPQRKGTFTIPPVRFTYFDTDARAYRTAQTDSFHIEVLKGDNVESDVHDYSGSENPQQAGDIQPLRTGNDRSQTGSSFYASSTYWVLLAALLLAFAAAFAIIRMRAATRADAVKAKGRRANKVAVRRLRKAAQLMKGGKPGEFYDETLRALWGYVGDKLNIPVSQLSRENISQRLAEHGVDAETTESFIGAIDECEFVRYAPGDPQGNMNRVYDKSVTAIERIESVRPKSKKKVAVSPTLLLLACFIAVAGAASAQTKMEADEAYSEQEYEQAIDIYHQLLQQAPSADIYYNLGNAYYRLDSLPQAILAWERALRLSPSADDVRFNLQLARSKTADKLAPEREMFFITWYRSLVRLFGVDVWAIVAVASLAAALLLVLVWFFAYEEKTRRLAFFGAVVLIALFLLANLFAWQQRKALNSHTDAIVMQSAVSVRNIPADNGSEEFTIHAGTKVSVTDDTINEWRQVKLPDGRQGWVKVTDIEAI
jgi:tetratricopeptide (TPR) repeat protein